LIKIHEEELDFAYSGPTGFEGILSQTKDHFLMEDYGLIKIHEEDLDFAYSGPKGFDGILKIHLLLEPLETPIPLLTQEIVEQ